VRLLGDDERLVDEPREQVDDPAALDRSAGADALRGVEREPAGEDREPAEEDALGARQEVVAPGDRPPQRLLARQRGPAAGGEHVEAVGQARRDLGGRERGRACGRELERERHPVQAPAQLGHGGGRVRAGLEAGVRRRGAVGEEPRGLRVADVVALGERERRHAPRHLARAVQRLAARRQQAHGGRAEEHRLGEVRAGRDEVLAIVEHEQRSPPREVADERVERGALRGHRDAERRERGLGDESRIAEPRELDEPDAVGRRVQGRAADLEGEPRLAAAAGTGQRKQSRALERAGDLRLLAPAAHEARQRAREVVARPLGVGLAKQLAIEGTRLGVGVGAEVAAQRLPQLLEVRERLLTAARAGIEAHERAVRGLVQRGGDERALERGGGLGGVALELGQLEAERDVLLAQRLAPGVRPRLVAVLGQQLAAVERERVAQRLRLPGAAGGGGGGLEVGGVDAHVGRECDRRVDERERVRAAEGASRGMQRLVQVVRRGARVAIGPQRLGGDVAVHAALRRDGDELDERLGLAQAPRPVVDGHAVDLRGEPAEQVQLEAGHGRPSTLHGRSPQLTSVIAAAITNAPAQTCSVFSHALRSTRTPRRS
jgi:hypothetical protein